MRGTPLYLAPELFDGAHASVSTDIYASGVLLYYLVTGGFPVNASSMEALAEMHRRGVRNRLQDERPDLPHSFVAVVERAIDPDPARRFASAGEMYAALGDRDKEGAGAKLTTRQKLLRVALAVVGLLAVTEGLGLLTSKAFESALRVDPEFATGALDFLMAGQRALLPFVFVWALAAAGVAVLAAFRPLIWPRLGPVRRRLAALVEQVEPSTQAGLVVCAGAVGFLALFWQFWGVFTTP